MVSIAPIFSTESIESHAICSESITQRYKSRKPRFPRKYSLPATATSAPGIHHHRKNQMTHLILALILFQNPSLDSASPKERQAAVEEMATLGNREAIPRLAEALKKESRSDVRATIVAGFGRIRDREAIPPLADTLKSDLDKDVRSQAIDSFLRLYIPLEDSGPLRTIFNRVKSVFFGPNPPVVGPEVQVDSSAKEALATAMQKDFNDDVRSEAASALGSLRAIDQIPTMVAALEDPQNREHNNVRLAIVRALGQIRDASAGPALERALRDSNKPVMLEAILSIGLVGHAPARPLLEQMFKTGD